MHRTTKDGKKQVYVERYLFGDKTSEYPINDGLFLHGEGRAFRFGTDSISDILHFTNGYRTGEWVNFNEAGEPVEKRIYKNGRLLLISKLEDGKWKSTLAKDLPLMKRLAEEIQRISQPFKSNHKYFED